jgi:TatA/E family protein of Tat protein translocase
VFGLGFGELILILIIALIFVGPKKLPELAKGLGKGIRDFQNAAKGLGDELQNIDKEPPPKKVVDATNHEDVPATEIDPEEKDSHHS